MNSGGTSEKENIEASHNPVHSTSLECDNNGKNEDKTSKDITYNESFETACSKSFSEYNTEKDMDSEFNSSLTNENIYVSDTQNTPWEEWLYKKEKERRRQFYKRKEERNQKLLVEQHEKKIESQKKVCATNAYKNWLCKIQENEKKQIKLEKERAEKKKQNKEEKEKNIKILSEKNFKLWMMQKKELEDEKKKQVEMNKIDKLQQKILDTKKNEEAFRDWKRNTCKRSKSQNYVGYGYVGGVLIGYYDASSSPTPSYYNPKPWI